MNILSYSSVAELNPAFFSRNSTRSSAY